MLPISRPIVEVMAHPVSGQPSAQARTCVRAPSGSARRRRLFIPFLPFFLDISSILAY